MIVEMMNSMVRFTAAVSVYGLQQMQFMMTSPGQVLKSVDHMREAMDSASQALTSNVDDQQNALMHSITNTSSDLMSRTLDMIDISMFDPRRYVDVATDVARKTSDAVLGTGGGKAA